MSKISMVETAKATACKPVGASIFVEAVISGRWRDKIESIRRTYQMTMEQTGGDSKNAGATISRIKRKLPAVIWAGEFSKREANGLKEYSGLLVPIFPPFLFSSSISPQEKPPAGRRNWPQLIVYYQYCFNSGTKMLKTC